MTEKDIYARDVMYGWPPRRLSRPQLDDGERRHLCETARHILQGDYIDDVIYAKNVIYGRRDEPSATSMIQTTSWRRGKPHR
jgi:hypothetical protein